MVGLDAGASASVERNDEDIALDTLSVHSIRLLCADMVDKANSGHLGAPFGCAPLANALWSRIMQFSPRKRWMNRDRFVLSMGHASALYYTMLHVSGNGAGGPYEVSMDRLRQFRQAGSSTPGHPEFRMTSGVEVTTGPLGQGFANGVGMAMAEAHLSARFNREGFPLFDHYTYVLAGDGCMMEGVTNEAASLAGHLKLHKLIVFYDDNKITIDATTDFTFTEDVGGSFAAKGWNVLHIANGDLYDSAVYVKVVEEAKSQSERPTLVVMKTTAGKGAGSWIEGKPKAHGDGPRKTIDEMRQNTHSPAGLQAAGDSISTIMAKWVQQELDDLAAYTSQVSCNHCGNSVKHQDHHILPKFHVPKKVLLRFREYGARGDALADEWQAMVKRYCSTFREQEPDLVGDLENRMQGKYMTDKWRAAVSEYLCTEQLAIEKGIGVLRNGNGHPAHREKEEPAKEEPDAKRQKVETFKYKAGRVYCAEVLRTMVEMNPSIIGGSADVASSSGGHFPKLQGHFLPPCYGEKIEGANYGSRYIHFGVREHGMLAILNGISSYAGLVPYCTMFTVFYQYGLPAIRMAAISKFPVLYIGTHDSIDLGEDGPTHQPVEVLPQLRAMPNLLVIRPASVEEMVGAFRVFEEQYVDKRVLNEYIDPKPLVRRPVFIMTSRGELGLPYKPNTDVRGEDGVMRGAYVVHECFDSHQKNEVLGAAHGSDPLPDIVLIGSGQDVALVMKTKEILLDWSNKFNEQLRVAFSNFPSAALIPLPKQMKIRIVSMPCWELFDEQDEEYQDSVLLSNYDDILRIYVEKAATKNTGHDKYAHFSVLMSGFGLSGKAADVEKKLEFTPDFIAAKVWAEWVDRGRRLQRAGDTADEGEKTWVSRLRHRMGSH